jgi:phage FluMu gp28-like protein
MMRKPVDPPRPDGHPSQEGTSSEALIPFWDFQRELIIDPARMILVDWARGNGKSFCIAGKIVLDSFDNEAIGKPSDWLIVSATREQAKEALEKCQDFARAVYAIAEHLEIIEEEGTTPDGKERYTRFLLRLGNRTKVMAISASPKAVRGYTSNIWWDEAAFFDDDQEMYESLKHCTRGKLKMLISSTPWGGSDRRFYELLHDETIINGQPLWSKHICDIYQAVAGGRPYDIEMERASSKPDKWAREMELQWIDDSTSWFSSSLLDKSEDDRASVDGSGYRGGNCYLGNDIGLRGDKWVAWVLEDQSGEMVTVEVATLDRLAQEDFDEHDLVIARLFKKYRIVRMCIDQTGMGERSTQKYQKLYGNSRVEGVVFNANNKGAIAVLTKELMEERRLLLPKNQSAIRADLRTLKKTVSASGNVRFAAERTAEGHGDYYSALSLAANAAITPFVPIEFKAHGREQREEEFAGYQF